MKIKLDLICLGGKYYKKFKKTDSYVLIILL